MPRSSTTTVNEFNAGDIVQLKSGGPKMTVHESDARGGVYCQWFTGTKLEYGYFNQNILKKVEEVKEVKS